MRAKPIERLVFVLQESRVWKNLTTILTQLGVLAVQAIAKMEERMGKAEKDANEWREKAEQAEILLRNSISKSSDDEVSKAISATKCALSVVLAS